MRTDIPLHAQLVQTAHAAFEMGLRIKKNPERVSFLIVLTVKNEEALQKAKIYLDEHNIDNYMFYEPDYDMGYTAICSEPVYDEDRRLFKKFKLWKM